MISRIQNDNMPMKMDKEMPNNEREDTNENMSDWELLTRFARGGEGGVSSSKGFANFVSYPR